VMTNIDFRPRPMNLGKGFQHYNMLLGQTMALSQRPTIAQHLIGGGPAKTFAEAYEQAAWKVHYSYGAEVAADELSAPVAPAAPRAASVAETGWRSFLKGFSMTFGVAQIRRSVETPEQAFRAAAADLTQAIKDNKERG
jgi:hypothetical protein